MIQIWYFQFWLVKNLTNIEGNTFPSHICHLSAKKTWWGCLWPFKFGTQANHFVLQKSTLKLFFKGGHSSLWKLYFLAYKYLPNLCQMFSNSKRTRPQKLHILPAAYLNCNWCCCKSSISSWPYSTGPKKYIKSETGQKTIPKYSVWNNWISRKWGRRKKVRYWKFY